jgi:hypothetical protein
MQRALSSVLNVVIGAGARMCATVLCFASAVGAEVADEGLTARPRVGGTVLPQASLQHPTWAPRSLLVS